MYQLNKDQTSLIRETDGAHIPLAFGNRDFNEAFDALSAKNLITEKDGVFSFLPDENILKSFPDVALADLQLQLCDQIDSDAANTRAAFITTGAGQDATYTAKAAEFKAFVAAGKPTTYATDSLGIGYYQDVNSVTYYYVVAEVTALGYDASKVTADQLQAAIDNVLKTLDTWTPINALIESLRLGGKTKIKAAADNATARAIYEDVSSKLNAVKADS